MTEDQKKLLEHYAQQSKLFTADEMQDIFAHFIDEFNIKALLCLLDKKYNTKYYPHLTRVQKFNVDTHRQVFTFINTKVIENFCKNSFKNVFTPKLCEHIASIFIEYKKAQLFWGYENAADTYDFNIMCGKKLVDALYNILDNNNYKVTKMLYAFSGPNDLYAVCERLLPFCKLFLERFIEKSLPKGVVEISDTNYYNDEEKAEIKFMHDFLIS